MTQPDITVVVPVHDAMPYLVTCLASLLEQSIGLDRFEVVAVDNGSTDQSGTVLDLVASRWAGLRVRHQEDSHGPSSPRNLGLDVAAGRYIYFLDADDYLGPEALERLLAAAEEHGSDMVLCQRKQISGRKAHILAPDKTRRTGFSATFVPPWLDDGPIVDDVAVQMTARSDCKHLFRRDRIEQLGLRFKEGMHFGEDSLFSATYAEGASISVAPDYLCYYERLREDGRNLTTLLTGTEMHLDAMEHGWLLAAEHEPAWRQMMQARTVAAELCQLIFGDRFWQHDLAVRRRLMQRARSILDTRVPPRAAARLPALSRLKMELVRREMEPEITEVARAAAADERAKDIVSAGRVYAGYPYFRDPGAGIPDECYDVTDELAVVHHLASLSWAGSTLRMAGYAFIEHVESASMTTTVVLRRRVRAGEHQLTARPAAIAGLTEECGQGRYDHGLAGFDAEIDLADLDGHPLAPGDWGVFLAVTAQGVRKETPLGRSRDPSAESPPRAAGDAPFSARFDRHETLVLHVPDDQAGPGSPIANLAQPKASA